MFKKVTSVVLAALMLLSVFAASAFAKTSEEVDTHLQYNENGKFTIMHITDIQDLFPMKAGTKKMLKAALKEYAPDIAVLTGDNISSTSLTAGYAALAINEFMSIFEDERIPVAMTFGNHDDERTLATKEKQLAVYEKYDCFIGCAGEDLGDTNLCTYYVPLYSSTDKNDMTNVIWMVDSGTYNTENDLGGYAATTKAQIEWYKSASAKLEAANGGKVPGLMFQHIVVPEIFDALAITDKPGENTISRNNNYYTLPQGSAGVLGETPCPPNYNNGQFDAVLERGDVMAMFFGHDHVNTYQVPYKGVDLINTAGMGFNSYNSYDVGFRLIYLDETQPDTFTTESVSYFDLLGYDNDAARYLFKMESDTTDSATKFACFFKYIFAAIKEFFASLF